MSSTFQRVSAEQQMLSVAYSSGSLLFQHGLRLRASVPAQQLWHQSQKTVCAVLFQEAPNSHCTNTISQELPRFIFI